MIVTRSIEVRYILITRFPLLPMPKAKGGGFEKSWNVRVISVYHAQTRQSDNACKIDTNLSSAELFSQPFRKSTRNGPI